MSSPYGQKRGAAVYYQYGGVPAHYAYNWTGLPPAGVRAAETRGLSGVLTGPILLGDSLDVSASAHYHRDLGAIPTDWPVAMSMQAPRRSIRHSGAEQGKMYDGLGIFGSLSNNEKTLMKVAAAGAVAFIAYKVWKKKKR